MMRTIGVFFALVVLGAIVGVNAYGQSINVDPHGPYIEGSLIARQHAIGTPYITGDPHEREISAAGVRQHDISTIYIEGDPHDRGKSAHALPDRRRPIMAPYLIGDPHR